MPKWWFVSGCQCLGFAARVVSTAVHPTLAGALMNLKGAYNLFITNKPDFRDGGKLKIEIEIEFDFM